jgi:hypothetical protein
MMAQSARKERKKEEDAKNCILLSILHALPNNIRKYQMKENETARHAHSGERQVRT